ncbi:MAG: hypothetical protein AB7O43_13175, partial [Hyphomicrobiaceae bacterium]
MLRSRSTALARTPITDAEDQDCARVRDPTRLAGSTHAHYPVARLKSLRLGVIVQNERMRFLIGNRRQDAVALR